MMVLFVFVIFIVFLANYRFISADEIEYHYARRLSHHRHKHLFPLNPIDILGTLIITLGLILAASGGVGGGGVLLAVLVLVLHFTSKQAIPISNMAIFGGSIANLVLNFPKRHPEADRPILDWNLICMLQPFALIGAIIGAYLSKLIPDHILSILLVLILGYAAYRSFEKGMELYRKEGYRKLPDEDKFLNENERSDEHDDKNELANPILSAHHNDNNNNSNNISNQNGFIEIGIDDHENNENHIQKCDIINKEKQHPLFKIEIIILLFVIVTILNVVKFVTACGSVSYWMIESLNIAWIICISLFLRYLLLEEWKIKASVQYQYCHGEIEWNERNTLIYPPISIFAGLLASTFGIGGGIVFGPLMLEMGVHPLVAYATSSAMIFFTTFIAATSYLVLGTLVIDYGIYFLFIGFISTAIGQIIVNYFVKKYNKVSFISFCVAIVVFTATAVMVMHTVKLFLGESRDVKMSVCGKNE